MTHSGKSTKWLVTMMIAICICIAVLLAGTFSLLTATKTATGTITFNLAEYEMHFLHQANSANIAPGKTGTTESVRLVNSYQTDTTGATAGLGPVYIKMNNLAGTVAGATLAASTLSTSSVGSDGKITVATVSSLGITIKLLPTAGTNLYWNVLDSTGNIYLVSSSKGTTKTTLAYSDYKGANPTYANIQFEIVANAPTINNGFNASGTASNTLNNSKQNTSVSISYKIEWSVSNTGF